MRADDGFIVNFTSASTSASFQLVGGKYGITGHAASWNAGNATLQVRAADDSTWLTAATAISVDGYQTADLMPGLYRVVLTTTAAANIGVSRIPQD